MNPVHQSDAELCKWLRENSSGYYRSTELAADRIEALNQQLADMLAEREATRREIKESWSAARSVSREVYRSPLTLRKIFEKTCCQTPPECV